MRVFKTILLTLAIIYISFTIPDKAEAANIETTGLQEIVFMWKTDEGLVRAIDIAGQVAEFNYVTWSIKQNSLGSYVNKDENSDWILYKAGGDNFSVFNCKTGQIIQGVAPGSAPAGWQPDRSYLIYNQKIYVVKRTILDVYNLSFTKIGTQTYTANGLDQGLILQIQGVQSGYLKAHIYEYGYDKYYKSFYSIQTSAPYNLDTNNYITGHKFFFSNVTGYYENYSAGIQVGNSGIYLENKSDYSRVKYRANSVWGHGIGLPRFGGTGLGFYYPGQTLTTPNNGVVYYTCTYDNFGNIILGGEGGRAITRSTAGTWHTDSNFYSDYLSGAILDAISSMSTKITDLQQKVNSIRVIKGVPFIKLIYGAVCNNTFENSEKNILVKTINNEYSIIEGTINNPLIGEKTGLGYYVLDTGLTKILFEVLNPPNINDVATVTFE